MNVEFFQIDSKIWGNGYNVEINESLFVRHKNKLKLNNDAAMSIWMYAMAYVEKTMSASSYVYLYGHKIRLGLSIYISIKDIVFSYKDTLSFL